ncbi:MAG: hypothetical protein JWQ90_5329 [Hydrocarboniphaga sp.]|uniref:hypothetical protein n=1 Tax=Hydrocarboniphaga sp. TaxID=2033016 RepID=UPI002634DDB6|nr:hypothetical protein [Hydrocarboniphaga sp.]MDB5972879.1 hypothetical protein [Hydrocarboniphaga sp.]
MLNWLIDVATMAVGALCVVAFLYGLIARNEVRPKRQFSRLDRRDFERLDRRREDLGPPTPDERRVGPRRARELI